MDRVELVGMVAGGLTTLAFVPQVVKTWRTGSARDFSLPMLLLFTLGVALWLAYGVLLMQVPIILPNAVTLVLTASILFVKVREA
jgi:MtN3 and saliva related transmembrane protein